MFWQLKIHDEGLRSILAREGDALLSSVCRHDIVVGGAKQPRGSNTNLLAAIDHHRPWQGASSGDNVIARYRFIL